MTSRRFKVLIEWDTEESVWVTYVPALNHLSTYGESREEALDNTREAIAGYLEAAAKEHLTVSSEEPSIELVDVEVLTA
jgi:predicted RNase H-like HicB family nuclease